MNGSILFLRFRIIDLLGEGYGMDTDLKKQFAFTRQNARAQLQRIELCA